MDPNHVAILNNLGNVLVRWYDRSRDVADVDEAIASFSAVGATVLAPWRRCGCTRREVGVLRTAVG
jgi:hypothetical protein